MLNTAVVAEMLILGALLIELVGRAQNGDLFVWKQLCFIARGLKTLYLSQGACKDLRLIAENLPKIGSNRKVTLGTVRTGEDRVSVGKVANTGDEMEKFADIFGERSPWQSDQSGLCHRRGETPAPPLPAYPMTQMYIFSKWKRFISQKNFAHETMKI